MNTRLDLPRAIAALMFATATAAAQIPQITQAEYAARRDSLAARIGTGVVIGLGAPDPVADFGPFYQLPAFHYLTGFDEPNAGWILVARGGRVASATLFVAPTNPMRLFYYGKLPDSATVESQLGMKARSFSALQRVADSLARTGLSFYELADFSDADFARQDSLTRGRSFMKALVSRNKKLKVRDAHEIVDQLRARKSATEIALLRRAAEISSEGHRAAMLTPEPQHEYELQAAVEGTFTRLGGRRVAYGSIVGAGINGTTLHYMKDRAAARPGDLVVIDAATEFDGYAADVTRTIPVSGQYTERQRAIYQLVRDAQAAAERNSQPGMSATTATDSAYFLRARGLVALGLAASLDASIDPPWKARCIQNPRACTEASFWMIHGISHGIGLAVHDPAQFYAEDHTYKVGDAFTIEPGIYVSSNMLAQLEDTPKNRAFIARVKDVVAQYENTGVRIEDDYIITDRGLERISTAPREIPEIEALMRQRPTRVVP